MIGVCDMTISWYIRIFERTLTYIWSICWIYRQEYVYHTNICLPRFLYKFEEFSLNISYITHNTYSKRCSWFVRCFGCRIYTMTTSNTRCVLYTYQTMIIFVRRCIDVVISRTAVKFFIICCWWFVYFGYTCACDVKIKLSRCSRSNQWNNFCVASYRKLSRLINTRYC